MFNFENISLSFSHSHWYFFLFLVLLAGYSFYVYHYTIPKILPARKIFLSVLRATALALILFLFFEPVLTLAKKNIIEPVNLIFMDNSRSIQINDGLNREITEKEFILGLKQNNLENNSKLYTFGSKISPLNYDSLQKLNFNEGSTNISQIFSSINTSKNNIASIVLVSDGVITDGIDPSNMATKLGIPIYTIGLGDTTARNDVWIKNVLANDIIYSGTQTSISVTVSNTGFANKNIIATLFEDGNQVDKQNILLSGEGVQNVNFAYTPKTGGEKKLTVTLSESKGEFTYANNKKIFYVNVLSNKVKILILSGSPSVDLSFIRNSLLSDTNLSVNSYVQISSNQFLEKNFTQKEIDSANILFLIGFPARNTPEELFRKIITEITQNDKPFLIDISSGVDFRRLQDLHSELGFSYNNINSDYLEVQPDISSGEDNNPLLQNNSTNIIQAWDNLPPVYQPNIDFISKPESEILARIKVNNVPINKPLILLRRLGNKKSISILAKDIWRWKLGTAPKNLDLFDRFILSSVKWLNAKDKNKLVTIKTSKKIYSLGENVDFTAQVYDQTFNPISDADVKVGINGGSNYSQLILNSIGNGIYTGSFQTNIAGDYKYSGEAILDGKKIGNDNGNFNLGEVDIEMINPRMNYDFLNLLSNNSGGKFYYNKNYNGIYQNLKLIEKNSSKVKIETREIYLWSDSWLLIAAIILFGMEWFYRKRWGML